MPKGKKAPPSEVRVEGPDAFVMLRGDVEAIIDATDVGEVQGYAWILSQLPSGHRYAYRYQNGKYVLMHRQLLNAGCGQYVDHTDGDGLNNRRSNIRTCSPAQNLANKAADPRSLLGIKGVSPSRGKFMAHITPSGKKIFLGRFDTAEEASAAYIGAARILWGPFARQK